MLSVKPLRLIAVVRLLLGVAVCICSLGLVVAVIQRFQSPDKLSPQNIVNLETLVPRLSRPVASDHVSVYLAGQFSPATRRELAHYSGGADAALQQALANDLNRIAQTNSIYNPSRFSGIKLSEDTSSLLADKPTGPDLVRLNLGLLTDAYPHEISWEPQDSPLYLAAITFGMHGSIFFVICLFLRRERVTWSEAFGFSRHGIVKAALLGVGVMLLFLPVGMWLQYESVRILTRFGFETPQQEALQTLQSSGGGLSLVMLCVFTVFVAPPVEEMLFRGILYPVIKQSGFPRTALWGTAVLFAFIHHSAAIFVPLTVLALALTFLYEVTDNLLAPIVAHSFFNAVNLVFWYYNNYGGPHSRG